MNFLEGFDRLCDSSSSSEKMTGNKLKFQLLNT